MLNNAHYRSGGITLKIGEVPQECFSGSDDRESLGLDLKDQMSKVGLIHQEYSYQSMLRKGLLSRT